jgi:DNA-binding response OmpR family regulator
MFLSGAGYETDRQSAMNNGAQSYLVKPVDMDELCREVSALLNGAKKDPSAGALHMDHLNLCGCSDDEATIGLPLGLAKAS